MVHTCNKMAYSIEIYHSSKIIVVLQISTSVSLVWTTVTPVLCAPILLEAFLVHVALATLEME